MEYFVGKTVKDPSGTTIGRVTDVITDAALQPEFVTIKTGRLLGREHVAPVEAMTPEGDELRASFSRDEVAAAPTTRDHILDMDQRTAIYEHFHIDHHAA